MRRLQISKIPENLAERVDPDIESNTFSPIGKLLAMADRSEQCFMTGCEWERESLAMQLQ